MKLTLSILFALVLFTTGCSLVSCNHVFPSPKWYWSADAKACRAEKARDKQADAETKISK